VGFFLWYINPEIQFTCGWLNDLQNMGRPPTGKNILGALGVHFSSRGLLLF
jgi:hypothetical protein